MTVKGACETICELQSSSSRVKFHGWSIGTAPAMNLRFLSSCWVEVLKSTSPIVDFSEFELNKVVADLDEIYQHNPHRFELALLDGILFIDEERAVGYKELTENEFWIRGHFPDRAVMPGVLICEAAAQLTAFFGSYHGLRGEGYMGLGGLEQIRFRTPVVPGDTLVVMLKKTRFRKGFVIFTEFQAYVGDTLCTEGVIKGAMLND